MGWGWDSGPQPALPLKNGLGWATCWERGRREGHLASVEAAGCFWQQMGKLDCGCFVERCPVSVSPQMLLMPERARRQQGRGGGGVELTAALPPPAGGVLLCGSFASKPWIPPVGVEVRTVLTQSI